MSLSITSTPVANSPEPSIARPVARKAYLVGLDSLRAVAALSVCLFHFTNGALPKCIVPTAKQLFSQGGLGVEIFFVISGFIIPYSMLGKHHRATGFFAYLKKRVIRINPPAYAAIALVLAQWVLIDRFIQHSTTYTQNITLPRLIHNLLFTIPFTHYQWFIGVFWTLAIEFQFYILVGLLFTPLFEGRHLGWFWLVYLLAQVVPLLVPLPPVNFFRYSSLFALGGLALLWQQQRLSRVVYVGGLLLFAGLAYWRLGGYVAGVGLGTALALNVVKFSVPGLSFLGRISYSFYLLHVLIGTSCEFVLIKIIPPVTAINKLAIISVCLVAAITGAYIFYRVVEQPMMRLAARQR